MRHFRKTLGLTAGRAGAAPLLVAPLLVIALAHPAGALVITPTFETGMPQAARDAIVNIVIPEFQTLFANPVTVSIEFDWGDTAGQAFDTGASTLFAKFPGYSLATAEQLLSQAATAVSPANAVLNAALAGNQPATFPAGSGGSLFFIPDPQLQALTGSASASYGPEAYVGFASNFCGTGSSCVYDYTGGVPAANAIDFVAVAEHELSHALGRVDYAFASGTSGGSPPFMTPLSFYKYDCATHQRDPSFNATCLSLNGGATFLSSGLSSGIFSNASDSGDWSVSNGVGNDSFDAGIGPGELALMSTVDIVELCALGWNATSCQAGGAAALLAGAGNPVPEPGSLAILGVSLLGLRTMRRQRAA